MAMTMSLDNKLKVDCRLWSVSESQYFEGLDLGSSGYNSDLVLTDNLTS